MLPLSAKRGPEYLIRFDDICPTMAWSVWNELEHILIANDVRPIVAVVPDNQDSYLRRESADPNFWERVRGWQERGWTIGLHGYRHTYVTECRGLVGLNRYSEFAGLPLAEQHSKLAAGLDILGAEGVHPDLWVAPGHTFDAQTLQALRTLGITDVSDGFGLYPHTDREGTFWIPQQLGRFHLFPAGLWTVCIHIDDPEHADVKAFARHIETFRPYLTTVPEVRTRYADNRHRLLSSACGSVLRLSKELSHLASRPKANC